MKEAPVEKRLVDGLTAYGFKVLKLTTPGTIGTPDRIILRPKWSPGPPWVIELKRPKKHERRLQELVRDEWRERGVRVLDMVNDYDQVDRLIVTLTAVCCGDDLANPRAADEILKRLRQDYVHLNAS